MATQPNACPLGGCWLSNVCQRPTYDDGRRGQVLADSSFLLAPPEHRFGGVSESSTATPLPLPSLRHV